MPHTQGPWKINDGELVAVGPNNDSAAVIGQIYGADDYPCCEEDIDEECKANGRLIAAAPDLLEACLYCQDMLAQKVGNETLAARIGLSGGYRAAKLLDDAITKATQGA